MKRYKKISRNAKCPCGSEKKYKHCCINKEYKYVVYEDGTIAKKIKIDNPEIWKELERRKESFVETFGREPMGEDPLFYDYNDPIEKYQAEIISVMEQAGIAPQLIYAYKKTGLLVTEENMNKISDLDLEEWRSAIEEYSNINTKPELDHFDHIIKETNNCINLYSLLIHKWGDISSDDISFFSQHEYIFFCLTKTLKSIRSILNQLDNILIEDSYILLRSIHENYLNIVYVVNKPEKLSDLIAEKVGVERGTHKYDIKPNGKENKQILVEISSGEKIDIGRGTTGYDMASCSKYIEDTKIYNLLYKFASYFTHTNLLASENFIEHNKFNPSKYNSPRQVLTLSIFLTSITLEKLLYIDSIDQISKKDILTFLNRVVPLLIDMFTSMNIEPSLKDLNIECYNRLQSLSEALTIKS
ncbi:SEC-C domain-containing protein [Brevibacillus brevis]|uniref:SEC-C domain-containing protein n=1 Tax=Brevibacillus brevis TaxID=1393 RepID=A0A517IF34_BREBE|nr:SEC-C domain-containing protein [Brevibacillus brevis]QDS37492.1 SEC-C domain-containing protein [Brevibacillus brevis]